MKKKNKTRSGSVAKQPTRFFQGKGPGEFFQPTAKRKAKVQAKKDSTEYDALERQADRVADQYSSHANGKAVKQPLSKQISPRIQRKTAESATPDKELEQETPQLQVEESIPERAAEAELTPQLKDEEPTTNLEAPDPTAQMKQEEDTPQAKTDIELDPNENDGLTESEFAPQEKSEGGIPQTETQYQEEQAAEDVSTSSPQTKTEETATKEEDPALQKKPSEGAAEEKIQAKGESATHPTFYSTLKKAKSRGNPLPEGLRTQLEDGFRRRFQ